MAESTTSQGTLDFRSSGGELSLHFAGLWRRSAAPLLRSLREDLTQRVAGAKRISFDVSEVGEWDSTLPMAITRSLEIASGLGLKADLSGLPAGLARLVALSRSVPERKADEAGPSLGWLGQLGEVVLRHLRSAREFVSFLGETTLSCARFLLARAQFRWRDLFLLLESCGIQALPIVGMLSFLVGVILAFVASVQLRLFGADIYVADLVGLAIVREMGALVTAIIMAGRSGAAFAAHLGTMRVSEEIDALTTFGFRPVDMLVMPRVLAMFLMVPLLTVYSDFIGVLGGMFVACPMLDISFKQYVEETKTVMTLTQFLIGVSKGLFFGLLVALAGCFEGLRCGRDAAAVGVATTKAVVLGIVLIVCADAVFALVCESMDW